jgi:hypothetical protein
MWTIQPRGPYLRCFPTKEGQGIPPFPLAPFPLLSSFAGASLLTNGRSSNGMGF